MNFDAANRIARTLLYEGYLLYPYRASAVKNQRRWTFGCLLSPDFPLPSNSAEGSFSRTECLLVGDEKTEIEIRVRFLQVSSVSHGRLSLRESAELPFGLSENSGASHKRTFAERKATMQTEEIVEREVIVGPLRLSELLNQYTFAFPPIEGTVEISVQPFGDRLFKLSVALRNQTRLPNSGQLTRDESLPFALLSSHLVLGVTHGKFLSMQDPSAFAGEAATTCRSVRAWPVLVGDPKRCDMLLSAPIILADFPVVASESPADLFDATEMDEMLTLRIRTLTPGEKLEMAATDPRADVLLNRIERLDDLQLRNMHGVWRRDESVQIESSGIKPGMRVRLRPKGNADVYDIALAGKTALVVSIEQDFEDRVYVTVAIDDDPGQDYGIAGRPGHRFYFGLDEVEPIESSVRILVAGIGNIFLGDDAFGVEVVRLLLDRPTRESVVIKDFGIRGYDLACALQDGYDAAILVDAMQRGGPPGTLHVIEPDTNSPTTGRPMEMHQLDPVRVIDMVHQMGGMLPCLRVVGCEPATLELDESAGLSEPVRDAVPKAVVLIEALVADLLLLPLPGSGRMEVFHERA